MLESYSPFTYFQNTAWPEWDQVSECANCGGCVSASVWRQVGALIPLGLEGRKTHGLKSRERHTFPGELFPGKLGSPFNLF